MDENKKSKEDIIVGVLFGMAILASLIVTIILDVKIYRWLVSLLPDSPISPWIAGGGIVIIDILYNFVFLIFYPGKLDNADEQKDEQLALVDAENQKDYMGGESGENTGEIK